MKTPAQVTVNVYNATERTGLAAKTAADVRKRGFKVSTGQQRPAASRTSGGRRGPLRPTGASSSKLVLALVKGAKAVKDSRTDWSVDLVLGAKFTALTPAAEEDAVAHHLHLLTRPLNSALLNSAR